MGYSLAGASLVPSRLARRIALLLDAIRFEHSIFALPFAYIGMLLAARGVPEWWQVAWITVAMVCARTVAMAANRLIDRHLDRVNPRTAARALPTGRLSAREMSALTLVGLLGFAFAAAQLNDLCLKLTPIAAVVLLGYSYTKRFTWLSHFVLGFADAMAPAGGWIAVTGRLEWPAVLLAVAVGAWIAGFDLIYACQDIDFDRRAGLHSVPASFGIAATLWMSALSHVVTVTVLALLGAWLSLGPVYWVGLAIAAGLLAYEHAIVRPNDLSRLGVAFFDVNGYIAIVVFVFTLGALYHY